MGGLGTSDIEAARGWARGEVTVGEARNAAVAAHAAAREAVSSGTAAAARAAGHAAGTAHMADHAPQAAGYAVQAVQASVGGPDAWRPTASAPGSGTTFRMTFECL